MDAQPSPSTLYGQQFVIRSTKHTAIVQLLISGDLKIYVTRVSRYKVCLSASSFDHHLPAAAASRGMIAACHRHLFDVAQKKKQYKLRCERRMRNDSGYWSRVLIDGFRCTQYSPELPHTGTTGSVNVACTAVGLAKDYYVVGVNLDQFEDGPSEANFT